MALLSGLGNYKNFGLLVLRAGLGALMIYHGYPKLIGGPEMWGQLGASTKYLGFSFLPTVWGLLAALTETVGGLLFLIGFAFRPVSILLLINMIFASAMHLGNGDGMQGAAHAIELAFVFAGMIFIGPGKYSVDKR
ncbi:hypothetical protein GCM10023149_25810 [Mucilaginibacter gynuensis]|uniref:Oxidoreductase n=1 Tax=Mucilaginibacter gynuensis TaxID=1302236 RepID=A0ABP8GH40_9SPHI